MMDALYCGAKLLEEAGRRWLEAHGDAEQQQQQGAQQGAQQQQQDGEGQAATPGGVLIDARRGVFFFAGDAVALLERAAADAIPPFQSDAGKGGGAGELPLRTPAPDAADDAASRDSVERDERRLADLGRRCVEMHAAAHIAATYMEVRRLAALGCLAWAGWSGVALGCSLQLCVSRHAIGLPAPPPNPPTHPPLERRPPLWRRKPSSARRSC